MRSQCSDTNKNLSQIKIEKFLKDAKDELEPSAYESLIITLSNFHKGNFSSL